VIPKIRPNSLLAVAALAVALRIAPAQSPASVRGSVVDARGGEPLANVDIFLAGAPYRTRTGPDGRFSLPGIAPGAYTLNVSTVGYRMARKQFELSPGEAKEFEVILSSHTLRQSETVDVRRDPFDPASADSPSALVLAGNDAKNLGSVLADDPLRAVQGMPGVTANDDFEARFSLRGADYARLGLYLDGILLHTPFHTLQGQSSTGSATAFNNDMVDSIELHSGAFPVRYADRTAGALDIQTRDGNRAAPSFRASASASNAGLMAEGPLGKRGSWLAGARKSYLQYILDRTSTDSSLVFGMWDVQTRVAYDITSRQRISLNILDGISTLDRSSARSRLGVNSLLDATHRFTLANLAWNYTPSDKTLFTNRFAYMREKYENHNPTALPLAAGHYGEWVWNASATWMWNERNPLDAGFSLRRIRDGGFANAYQGTPPAVRQLDRFNGTAIRSGAYLQQSWRAWSGRVQMTGGARLDEHSIGRVAAASPHASIGISPVASTRLQFGWGQNVQYPEVAFLTSTTGSRRLLPERATHYIAAIEQRLGLRARVRVEAYNRLDRDLLFRSLFEPRLANGQIIAPPANAPIANNLRGYSRGLVVMVQRASANRLTGWASYAYGISRVRDGVLRQSWFADFDQRHTVNVYGGYRLRPSVNLSARWSYGSGFPIPGFLLRQGTSYFLAASRNQTRLPAYQRLDLRVNKSWSFQRWKLTLFGEVVNLTNHRNTRFDAFNGYNNRTGQANVTFNRMFPILPSAGIAFER